MTLILENMPIIRVQNSHCLKIFASLTTSRTAIGANAGLDWDVRKWKWVKSTTNWTKLDFFAFFHWIQHDRCKHPSRSNPIQVPCETLTLAIMNVFLCLQTKKNVHGLDILYYVEGDKWNINEILKICQDCNEHLLIANVRVWPVLQILHSLRQWQIWTRIIGIFSRINVNTAHTLNDNNHNTITWCGCFIIAVL